MAPILDSLKYFFSRSVRGISSTPEERAAEEATPRIQETQSCTTMGDSSSPVRAHVEAVADAPALGGLPADALVDITLKDAGERRLVVIKVIMSACGVGLAEAKACADNAPVVVLRGVRADEGRQFAREVSMAGGTTILAPAENAVTDLSPVPDTPADLPDDAVADLMLHAVGAHPVAVVKALYAHCGCDLKGAKDLADRAPVTVMEGVSLDELVPAYCALQEAGADVEVLTH